MESNKAYFAGGCFWCLEAVFKRLRGVLQVRSGFAGGTGIPEYSKENLEKTGYAETIEITYEPKIISYEILCEVFFKMHDPDNQHHDSGANEVFFPKHKKG